MSPTNRIYKRLEALLSEARPADPNPPQSTEGEVEALQSRIASPNAEREEIRARLDREAVSSESTPTPSKEKSAAPKASSGGVQAEELVAQVRELEAKMAGQAQAVNQGLSAPVSGEVSQPLTTRPVKERRRDSERQTITNQQDQVDAPVFSYSRWRENFLRTILYVTAGIGLIVIFAYALTSPNLFYTGLAIGFYILLVLFTFMRISYGYRAGFFLVLLSAICILTLLDTGIGADAPVFFLVTITMSTLIVSPLAGWVATAASLASIGAVGWLAHSGNFTLMSPDATLGEPSIWLQSGVYILLFALVIVNGLRLIQREFLNAQERADTTFVMLRAERANLAERVADRTHELELATEVGRTITEKVANLNEMLTEAVEMIRARFNLYYTQVYLVDPSGHALVLRAGTGEVGKQLLQRGHRLAVGASSLNGRAVMEKKPVIVVDTTQSGSFLPNPLLPKTRSEMVVPLIVAGQAFGALDMQSEIPGALNEANLTAFQALAGQLAVAIQNANLFTESREAREQMEANVRRFTEIGWQEFMNGIDRQERFGYVYGQGKTLSLEDSPQPLPEHALSVPLRVTGTTIGTIQAAGDGQGWTSQETEIVDATAARLSQHIEGLRLLAQAERYRAEAEQAVRRLTREGWEAYQQARSEMGRGFVFDLNNVQPLDGNDTDAAGPVTKRKLTVRNESIGELVVDSGFISKETAEILDSVVSQLSGHLENLRLSEQNEKRARELETVADLSVTTSTVLDPDRLLQAIVDLTKERFGVYHVHIYLANETWQTLLLASGAGEVGRKMVAENHTIAMDVEKSLVARAYRERQAVLVNDIRSEPDFLPNPHLPGTRSEMAVPMIVGDKVVGVFDVQADKVNGFMEEDANIYTTLASQVAVSLQNARLYVEQSATVTQLREFDRLKSSFLANMSHELRTPLNSILGFADVMLEELDGPLTENMNNDLQLIQKNGQHLLHLINDVLDMAKIEAGKMNLIPERFRLHEILEEVVSITSPLASEKALSLFIENSSDQETEVYADRTRIRQVMLNLVNNALKFTETGEISLHATRQGEKILIHVRDTGVGISPDKLDVVFQEFTQVDTSATRKVGGTGLGLPISRRLIEMHGGRMWAESAGVPGEGSTFYVELPIEAKITEAIEKMEK